MFFLYFDNLLSRFARGIEITYKLEAELFSGVKSSRVFFKGADANKPHEIERTMQLSLIKEPSDGFKAKDHAVYIYVRVMKYPYLLIN